MRKIHQKINSYEFRQRSRKLFHSYYMTMVSVIQGVALASLVYNVFNVHPKNINIIIYYLNAVLTFMFIVTVSYEYATFAGIWRWPYQAMDVFIPLLLGVAQSAPCYFLGEPEKWWIATAFLNCVALYAYRHTEKNIKAELFESNRQGKQAFNRSIELAKYTKNLMYMGILLSFLGIIFFWQSDTQELIHVVMIVLLACLTIKFVHKQEKWYSDMHKIYRYNFYK